MTTLFLSSRPAHYIDALLSRHNTCCCSHSCCCMFFARLDYIVPFTLFSSLLIATCQFRSIPFHHISPLLCSPRQRDRRRSVFPPGSLCIVIYLSICSLAVCFLIDSFLHRFHIAEVRFSCVYVSFGSVMCWLGLWCPMLCHRRPCLLYNMCQFYI